MPASTGTLAELCNGDEEVKVLITEAMTSGLMSAVRVKPGEAGVAP